jgi:hypothetical protein
MLMGGHCTQKLAAKLPEVSATPLAETSPLGSWHANLYTYDRRRVRIEKIRCNMARCYL